MSYRQELTRGNLSWLKSSQIIPLLLSSIIALYFPVTFAQESCFTKATFPHIFGSEKDANGFNGPDGDSRIEAMDYSPKDGGYLVYAGFTQDSNIEQSDYIFVARINMNGEFVFANHLHQKYNQVQIVKITEEDTIFIMARQQANDEFISMVTLNSDGTTIFGISKQFIKYKPWTTDITNPLGIVFLPFNQNTGEKIAFITTHGAESPIIGVQKIDIYSRGAADGLKWTIDSHIEDAIPGVNNGGYALAASYETNTLFLGGRFHVSRDGDVTRGAVIQTLDMTDGGKGWQVGIEQGNNNNFEEATVTGLTYQNYDGTGYLYASTLFENSLQFVRFELKDDDDEPDNQLRTIERKCLIRGMYSDQARFLWAIGMETTTNEAFMFRVNWNTGNTQEFPLLISGGSSNMLNDAVFTGPGTGFFGGSTSSLISYKECTGEWSEIFNQPDGFTVGYLMSISSPDRCAPSYDVPANTYNQMTTENFGEFQQTNFHFHYQDADQRRNQDTRDLTMDGADQISNYGVLSPLYNFIEREWCQRENPSNDVILTPTEIPDAVWPLDTNYNQDFGGFSAGGSSNCDLGTVDYTLVVYDINGNELPDSQHPFVFDGSSITAQATQRRLLGAGHDKNCDNIWWKDCDEGNIDDGINTGNNFGDFVAAGDVTFNLVLEGELLVDQCAEDNWVVSGLDCSNSNVNFAPNFSSPVELYPDSGIETYSIGWQTGKQGCGVNFSIFIDGQEYDSNNLGLVVDVDTSLDPLTIDVDTSFLVYPTTHEIKVVAFRNGSERGSYTFTIEALDPCLQSDVQFDFSLLDNPNILYLEFPAETQTVGFTTSVAGCEPSFQILQDSSPNPTLVTDVRVFADYIEIDLGAFSPQPENDYEITVVADLAGNQFSGAFFVTVKNGCKTLVPTVLPSFVNQINSVSFFIESTVDAIGLEFDEPLDCGFFTYSLVDAVDCDFNNCQSIDDLIQGVDYTLVTDDPSSTFTLEDPAVQLGPFEVFLQVDMGGFQTFTSAQSGVINLVNPCSSTVIDSQVINNISTTVKNASPDQKTSFNVFTDSVSCALGSQDCVTLCGDGQEYEVEVLGEATLPDWLQWNPTDKEVSVSALNNDDVGVFDVRITVTHTKYSSLQQYADFQVSIGACQVTDIAFPTVLSTFSYTVDEPVASYTLPSATLSPACGWDLTYVPSIPAELANYVDFDEASRTFTIQSDDNALDGSWTIGVTVTDDVSATPPSTVDLGIPVEISNSCQNDFATVWLAVDDFTYLINRDGDVVKTPEIRVSKMNCPLTITFEQTQAPVPLLGNEVYDSRIVSAYTETQSGASGKEWSADITFAVTDFQFDTEDMEPFPEFTWKVCTEGTGNDACASVIWTVNTVDFCWLQSLTAASWNDADRAIEVKAQLSDDVTFDYATSSSTECGVVSQQLLYSDGSPVDSNLFTLVGDTVTISPAQQEEGNVYEVIIRSVQGVYDQVQIDSDVLTVTIGPDACYDANIIANAQDIFDGLLTTSVLGGKVSSLRDGHIDDFGLCGQVTYNLYQVVANVRQAPPAFITHDDEDVFVEPIQNSDIGTFEMVLEVSLADFPDVTLDETFTVEVTSCEILSFTKSPSNLNFSYIIGEPEETTAYPVYTLTPACDYTAVYTLARQDGVSLSVNNFFTPNTIDFDTLIADGNEYQGTYDLVASVVFEFDGVEQLADDTEFSVVVSPDCNDAQIKANPEMIFGTGSVSTTIKADPLVDDRAAFQSSEGVCGTISYRLINNPIFVTHVDQNIRVEPTEDSQFGDYQVTLEVYLTEYPNVLLAEVFTVSVGYCVPTLSKVGDIAAFQYVIGETAEDIDYPTFVQEPACGYNVLYELQRQDGNPLDAAFTENDDFFTVFEDERGLAADYALVLSASFIYNNTLLASDATTEFTVTLKDPCEDVTIPETYTKDIFLTYYIETPTALDLEEFDAGFDSSLAGIGCGLDFSLTQDGYAAGEYDASVFSQVSAGVYGVQTSSLALDQTSIVLTITASGPISGATATSEVTVSFADQCRVTELTDASWDFTSVNGSNSASSYTYEFSIQEIAEGGVPEVDFFPAVDTLGRCGSVQYALSNNDPFATIDASGTVTFDGLTPSVASFSDKIVFNNNFVGGESPNTLTVSLIDECASAEFDNLELEDISASVLGGEKTTSFVSSNSVEDEFGAGVCDVTYRIVDSNGNAFSASWLNFNEQTKTFSVNPTLASQVDNYNLQVERIITNNENSKELLPFVIYIEECEVTSVGVISGIQDFEYTAGDDQLTKSFEFTQTPSCGYDLDFTATTVASNGAETAVTGEPFDIVGNSLTVFANDNSLADDWTVKIYANYGGVETFFLVDIEVLEQVEILAAVNNAPFFPGIDSNSVFQFEAGESFSLFIGPPLDIDEGDEDTLDVDVKMGSARSWMSWYERDWNFIVREGRTDEEDAGLYYIEVSVTDESGASTTQNVIIEILAPEVEEEEPVLLQVVSAVVEEDPEPLNVVQAVPTLEPKEFDPEGPSALITGLSNTGRMTIKFTKKMKVPDGWESLHDQLVEVSVDNRRRLQTVVEKQPIEISMIPSADSDLGDLGLDWEIISFTEEGIEIQVLFDDPERVSHTIDNDQIQIAFWDASLFQTESGEAFPTGSAAKKNAVRQIEPSVESERLEQATTAIKVTVLVVIFLTAIFFMYVGSSDNAYLWSFIMSGQVMFHLPLINVDMPGNAAYFCNILMGLSRLEVLDSEWVRKLFGLSLSPTPLESFEQAGYTSTHSLVNMATVFVLMVLLLALWITVGLLKACRTESTIKLGNTLSKYTFWLISIRLFLLSFIVVAISSFHNLAYVTADFSSLFSIFCITGLGVFTTIVTHAWIKCYGKSPEEIKAVQGWLCEIMYLRQGDNKAFFYVVLLVWRRVIFAAAGAFMPQFFAGQVFCFLFFSLLMCTVLFKYTPFSPMDNKLNWIALINELFLFLCGLSLLPMSNLVRGKEERWELGYFFIAVIITFLVWNVLMIICLGIDAFGKYLKRRAVEKPVVVPKQENVVKDRFFRKSGHLNISNLKSSVACSFDQLANTSPNASTTEAEIKPVKIVEAIIDTDEVDVYNKNHPQPKRRNSFEGVIWDENVRKKDRRQKIEVEDLSMIAEIPSMEKTHSNIRQREKDNKLPESGSSNPTGSDKSFSTNQSSQFRLQRTPAIQAALEDSDSLNELDISPATDSLTGNMLNDTEGMRLSSDDLQPLSMESALPEAHQVEQPQKQSDQSVVKMSFDSSFTSSMQSNMVSAQQPQNEASLILEDSSSTDNGGSKIDNLIAHKKSAVVHSAYSMDLLPHASMAQRPGAAADAMDPVYMTEDSEDSGFSNGISQILNSKMRAVSPQLQQDNASSSKESSGKVFSRKDLQTKKEPTIHDFSSLDYEQDSESVNNGPEQSSMQ